jgi:RNA polymerase sigma factor (sigma-70 family)
MRIADNDGHAGLHGDAEQAEYALLMRVATEDMLAFETLYRAYRPRLRRFITGITRQPALVEEVLDDTMMVVWRKAHACSHDAKVSTWIFAIAWRQALHALRRNDDRFESGDGEHTSSAEPGPDIELQQCELQQHLGTALARLSTEQRAVIELTYYMGYACREIAQIMDCPVDTVKTRMFYARRKLKTLLVLTQEEAI